MGHEGFIESNSRAILVRISRPVSNVQRLVKHYSQKLNSQSIFQDGIDLKSVSDIGEYYGQNACHPDVVANIFTIDWRSEICFESPALFPSFAFQNQINSCNYVKLGTSPGRWLFVNTPMYENDVSLRTITSFFSCQETIMITPSNRVIQCLLGRKSKPIYH